jgi:hypothetical protein
MKRYDLENNRHDYSQSMEEWRLGEWVKYEEASARIDELKRAICEAAIPLEVLRMTYCEGNYHREVLSPELQEHIRTAVEAIRDVLKEEKNG